MKIATYNVNGVNGRLPVLLRWLEQAKPDVVCLQELKAPEEKFPELALREAGYGAIWHGQKSWNGVAILARGAKPVETRRGLPGDPEDLHSRYIEAAVGGDHDRLPLSAERQSGARPEVRLQAEMVRAADRAMRPSCRRAATPVVLAGDYNVMPTELDVYKPERWVDDALFLPETRAAFHKLVAAGLDRRVRKLHPGRAHLHVLGLLPERLAAQRGPAHRPFPAEPGGRQAARRGRRRSRGARLGEDQRSRAGLDRAEAGERSCGRSPNSAAPRPAGCCAPIHAAPRRSAGRSSAARSRSTSAPSGHRCLRRSRSRHVDRKDKATTSSNIGLSRCQPIVTPVIFGDQRLLQALHIEAGDGGGALAQRLRKCGHRLARPQRAAGIVVAPAERDDPPLAEITVKFEGLERQGSICCTQAASSSRETASGQ